MFGKKIYEKIKLSEFYIFKIINIYSYTKIVAVVTLEKICGFCYAYYEKGFLFS